LIIALPVGDCLLLIGKKQTATSNKQTANEKSESEIICRGDPMWSPKIVNFKLKISSTHRGEDKGEGG
jgi:hypothetical protein